MCTIIYEKINAITKKPIESQNFTGCSDLQSTKHFILFDKINVLNSNCNVSINDNVIMVIDFINCTIEYYTIIEG